VVVVFFTEKRPKSQNNVATAAAATSGRKRGRPFKVQPTYKEVESSDEEEEYMNKRVATSSKSTRRRRSARRKIRNARLDDSDETEGLGLSSDDSTSTAPRNLKKRILSPTEPQPQVILDRVKTKKEEGAAGSAIDGDLLNAINLDPASGVIDLASESSKAGSDSEDGSEDGGRTKSSLIIVTHSEESDEGEESSVVFGIVSNRERGVKGESDEDEKLPGVVIEIVSNREEGVRGRQEVVPPPAAGLSPNSDADAETTELTSLVGQAVVVPVPPRDVNIVEPDPDAISVRGDAAWAGKIVSIRFGNEPARLCFVAPVESASDNSFKLNIPVPVQMSQSGEANQSTVVLNHVVVLKPEVLNDSAASSGNLNKLVVCQWKFGILGVMYLKIPFEIS
jgi:hypothetical protein